MSAPVSFRAGPDDSGERVDVVLARTLGITRVLAQRALRSGAVTVRGAAVRPSHRVEPGDAIEGRVPEPIFGPPEPEDIRVAVRYADERVLVVSKPAGLVTHPARGHEAGTLVNALLGLGVSLAGAGSTRPGIVHRLDKDTSGLLVVAKDDAAHAYLLAALRRRDVDRRYLALVRGHPPGGGGTGGGGGGGGRGGKREREREREGGGRGSIEAPVGRHPVRRRRMAVTGDGREAVTHYEVLGAIPEASLLEVTLETGRTHQIRVHLSHIGHPIVGDRVYGGASDLSRRLGLDRPFLHAWRLSFPSPDDGRRVEVADPLPDDLAAALGRAELRVPERFLSG